MQSLLDATVCAYNLTADFKSFDGNHELTNVNNVTFVEAQHSLAARVGLSNSRLEIASVDNVHRFGDVPFTYAVWAARQTSGQGASQCLLSVADNADGVLWYMHLTTTQNIPQLWPLSGAAPAVSADPIVDTDPRIYIVLHDPAANSLTMKIYKRGELTGQNTASRSGGLPNGTGTFRIGRQNNAGRQWNGWIGPVLIFNKVLDASEEAKLVNDGHKLGWPYRNLSQLERRTRGVNRGIVMGAH